LLPEISRDLLTAYSLPLPLLAAARLGKLAAAIDFSVYQIGWAISPIEFLGAGKSFCQDAFG
jgi:hypothetical protein